MATRQQATRRKTATPKTKATKSTLTKLQRQGLAALNDEDGQGAVTRQRKKSLATRTYKKIPAKHRVLRPAAWIAVGLAEVTGKALKHGGIGVGRVSQWGGRKIVAKVQSDVRYRKWTPGPPARKGGGRWFQPVMSLRCCDKHFSTIQGLNQHMVIAHRGEQRAAKHVRSRIQKSHVAKTAGKVIVRPKVAGGGRHRARHNLPGAKRAEVLIKAYQAQLAEVRKRVEKIMSTDLESIPGILQRAGASIGDVTVNSNTKLSELRATLIGMEMGMAAIADGIEQFGLTLRAERGAHIDPALVRPFITRATEAILIAGTEFTKFIVTFEDVYGVRILAARDELTTPTINLAG